LFWILKLPDPLRYKLNQNLLQILTPRYLSNFLAMNGIKISNGFKLPEPQEWELYATRGMAAYRAPSLSQPHKARKALADAHAGRIPPLMGMFCAIGSPQVTGIVAQMGFDFVWVEWEHASMSVERMTQVR
jgi:hypothetical protein